MRVPEKKETESERAPAYMCHTKMYYWKIQIKKQYCQTLLLRMKPLAHQCCAKLQSENIEKNWNRQWEHPHTSTAQEPWSRGRGAAGKNSPKSSWNEIYCVKAVWNWLLRDFTRLLLSANLFFRWVLGPLARSSSLVLYTHTPIHTYTYTHIHIHARICLYTYICIYVHTKIQREREKDIYIYIYMYVHAHICLYNYMYTYTYEYIHISKYVHTHTYIHTYVYVQVYLHPYLVLDLDLDLYQLFVYTSIVCVYWSDISTHA